MLQRCELWGTAGGHLGTRRTSVPIKECYGGDASLGALITPTSGIWGAGNSARLAAVSLLPHPPLRPAGSKESLFSSTITASEEAMTVLEEVIMYTFQQCVYYISKVCTPQGGGNNPQGQHEHPQQLLGCTEGIFSFKLLLFGSCITLRCFPLG